MNSHSQLFCLPVTSCLYGIAGGPVLASASTTPDAPGAEQRDCHHAEMDLTSTQPLGEGLLLSQDGFSGNNPPLNVTINPILEWPTAAAVPREVAWKKEKKNDCQGGKSTFLGPSAKRDDKV